MNEPLTLTKRIPARTHTVKARWCKREWMQMSQRYRAIRRKSGNPMDTCFWCRHKFEDGEMMALAAFEKGANKTLCQTCAGELLAPSSGERET